MLILYLVRQAHLKASRVIPDEISKHIISESEIVVEYEYLSSPDSNGELASLNERRQFVATGYTAKINHVL